MALDSLYRSTVLGVAGWQPLARFLRGRGLSLGVRRFVAGETAEEAAQVIRQLGDQDLATILDVLGEFVETEAAARDMTAQVTSGLRALAGAVADPALSVKPTQLGLGISFDLALDNAREVARVAQELGFDLCLDMESHEYVDRTLDLYRTLRAEGFSNVSTVLQAYLKRTQADLDSLLGSAEPPTLRIVKGAYKESPAVAFQRKDEIADGFRQMVRKLVLAGGKANIATHDDGLLKECKEFLQTADAPRYEFQFLYGVRPALQKSMRDEGHPVRIYVPYGNDWYGYFSRRLAERPANLMFVMRGLFG